MATVISTISNSEMIERLVNAAGMLRYGRNVVMKPGVLRASGWTPKQVIKFLLKEMNEQEAYVDEGFGDEVIIKVWMEQRPKDGCFVLKASLR
jgi:hypothetical protein